MSELRAQIREKSSTQSMSMTCFPLLSSEKAFKCRQLRSLHRQLVLVHGTCQLRWALGLQGAVIAWVSVAILKQTLWLEEAADVLLKDLDWEFCCLARIGSTSTRESGAEQRFRDREVLRFYQRANPSVVKWVMNINVDDLHCYAHDLTASHCIIAGDVCRLPNVICIVYMCVCCIVLYFA